MQYKIWIVLHKLYFSQTLMTDVQYVHPPTLSAVGQITIKYKQTAALAFPPRTQHVLLNVVSQRVRVGLMLHKWVEVVEYVWM